MSCSVYGTSSSACGSQPSCCWWNNACWSKGSCPDDDEYDDLNDDYNNAINPTPIWVSFLCIFVVFAMISCIFVRRAQWRQRMYATGNGANVTVIKSQPTTTTMNTGYNNNNYYNQDYTNMSYGNTPVQQGIPDYTNQEQYGIQQQQQQPYPYVPPSQGSYSSNMSGPYPAPPLPPQEDNIPIAYQQTTNTGYKY